MSLAPSIGRVVVLSFGVLCLFSPFAHAQGTSTATVAGVVKDSSGAVLPGVTVEAVEPGPDREGPVDHHRRARPVPAAGTAAGRVHRHVHAGRLRNRQERDALELRTNFTAQVDVELKVSQLEETITVTGATPLVDVTSATQQRTVSREVLDTVPTAKSVLGIAALIPAVVEPPNAQDVGGSKGERSVRITVHGGKTFDSRLLQDGMRYNALTPGIGSLEGTGRGYYVNPLAVQEVVIDLGTMGSAEYSLGGAQVNSIPKEGGNRFTGSIFLAGTGSGLQSDNLDDELRSQGLTSINSVKKVFDYNAAFGGPIVADRVWFFASGRRWGTTTGVANTYFDANPNDFVFTNDLNRPLEPEERDGGAGGRVTIQATKKDKFTFSYDWQKNFSEQLTGQLETGTVKTEANLGYCQRQDVTQGSWSRPQNNNLLFDAGVTISRFNFSNHGTDLYLSDYEQCGNGLPNNVSINDVGLGFTYGGVGFKQLALSHQTNGRVNVSIIKGSHTLKTGGFWMYGLGGGHRVYTERSPAQVNAPAGVVHLLERQPHVVDGVCRAVPDHRSTQPRSRAVCAGPVPLEPAHDQRRPAVRLGARIDCPDRVAGRAYRAGAVVSRTHRHSELEGSQSAIRHRVGSEGRCEDRHQVRHQPLRAVGHDGYGESPRPGPGQQQHDADLERLERQPAARLRPAEQPGAEQHRHRRRHLRRVGQPELRRFELDELA